jgi:hypothetical protein
MGFHLPGIKFWGFLASGQKYDEQESKPKDAAREFLMEAECLEIISHYLLL